MAPRFHVYPGSLVAVVAALPSVRARAADRGDGLEPSSEIREESRRVATAQGLPAVDETDLFATRRWAFEGHFGFGTPVGELGAVVEHAVLPFLGFGAGAGVGSGPDGGNYFHGAIVARARPLRGFTNALVVGGAYSFGGYREIHLGTESDEPGGNWMQWAQTELGWEHRWKDGLVFRFTFGGAWLLNPADLVCYNPSVYRCPSSPSKSLATLDLAVGYSL